MLFSSDRIQVLDRQTGALERDEQLDFEILDTK
jgi:hypothetical protein